jgi:hypothetical protein
VNEPFRFLGAGFSEGGVLKNRLTVSGYTFPGVDFRRMYLLRLRNPSYFLSRTDQVVALKPESQRYIYHIKYLQRIVFV